MCRSRGSPQESVGPCCLILPASVNTKEVSPGVFFLVSLYKTLCGSQKYLAVVVLVLDIVGIGHSELIGGEKLLGNWES